MFILISYSNKLLLGWVGLVEGWKGLEERKGTGSLFFHPFQILFTPNPKLHKLSILGSVNWLDKMLINYNKQFCPQGSFIADFTQIS